MSRRDGPHEIDVAVGAAIRRARLTRGLSQEQVGTAIGVSFQAVQKYERGENRIAASRLAMLAQYFGVSVSALFAGADSARRRDIGDRVSSAWAATLVDEVLRLPSGARYAILKLARSWNLLTATSAPRAGTARAAAVEPKHDDREDVGRH